MTDMQAWLDQGRALADQATEGPWYPWDRGVGWLIALSDSDDGEPRLPEGFRTDLGRGEDAAFIADARSRLPQAIDALQAVLNLHKRNIYGSCTSCVQNRYPCPTVRAVQNAIGGDDA